MTHPGEVRARLALQLQAARRSTSSASGCRRACEKRWRENPSQSRRRLSTRFIATTKSGRAAKPR